MSDDNPINDMWGDDDPNPTPTPEEEKDLRNMLHGVDMPEDTFSYDPYLKSATKAELMTLARSRGWKNRNQRSGMRTLLILVMIIVVLCGLAIGAYYLYTHIILGIVELLMWMM